jgi:hypothetical protein
MESNRRGQVIYLPKMFRLDEKLEFKSDNSTTMTNNIPDPITHHAMGNRKYYEKKLEVISAIKDSQIKKTHHQKRKPKKKATK